MYTIEEIRKAMERKELEAYYQPQFDAITGAVTSAEALVRWVREDGSIVPPLDFIPMLEETDAVNEVDWYMFDLACHFLRDLMDIGKQMKIAVNFSRRHVHEADALEHLKRIADQYKVPYERLEIEITESAILEEPGAIERLVQSIREAGFRIAIDDFGSGFSSLQLVKDLPIDVLKIDRSLLSHNCEDEKERIVLESIFLFAHRLHIETIAEGVETEQQLGFLRTCGCKKLQGFLMSHPIPAFDFRLLCEEEVQEQDEDILEIQSTASAQELLMQAVFAKYPMVIYANLTKNSYYMMAYDNYTTKTCPPTGDFDDMIVEASLTLAPEDQEKFRETFGRQSLMEANEKGVKSVPLVTRQLGDDGVWRRVETTDYFVKSPSSDDVLVISLNTPLED